MRTQNLVGTKEHYKAYKAGKRWLYACITVATVGLGLIGGTGVSAQADTDVNGTEPTTEKVSDTAVVSAEKTDASVQPAAVEETTPVAEVKGNEEIAKDSQSENDVIKADGNKDDVQVPENTGVQEDTSEKQQDPNTNIETQDKNVNGNKDEQQTSEVIGGQVDQTKQQVNKPAQAPATPAIDPVAPQVNKRSRMPMMRAAVVAVSGPKTLATVPVFRAPDFDSIIGKDASEWMPDANLRALIIGSIDQQYYNANNTVTSANLYQYAGFEGWMKYGVNAIQSYFDLDAIKSLEGLQYFTNLRCFDLSEAELPLSGMIDFSFAPNLQTFSLFNKNDVTTDWGISADQVMRTYFATNTQLQYLNLNNLNLTGGFPDLTAYPELYMLNLDDNQLTGNLPDISYLTSLFELSVNNNQLSGQLPDISNWAITFLRVSRNQFTGQLPSTKTLNSIEYGTNEITTAIAPGTYKTGAFVVGYGQTIDNGEHTLTNANNQFDPTEGVFDFMDFTTGEKVTNVKLVPGKFNNGATVVYSTDSTIGITNHNTWAETQTDASDWFTVVANPANPYSFLLVASPEAKSGNYVIRVKMADGISQDADAWVNFSVVNKMTTGTVTPETPEPGVTTGTVTVVSVDQDGKVIDQQVKTGNIGDTYSFDAPEITGYQATGVTHAQGTYTTAGQTVTFTYVQLNNAGDGATITDKTPTTEDTVKQGDIVTTGGAADTIATGKSEQSARSNRTTGQIRGMKTLKTTGRQATTNLATGHQAAKLTATKQADLPQTNEASSGNYILAGIATLLAALGMASLKLRKH